nr:RNA helicase [Actinomycetota bacterium]
LNELDVLGYGEWVTGLVSGLAAHHAGMIPPFKETVEELFARGLIKVVFATETLALGINMPARTVVIESLMKFTGEKHELITPGQYTQLSGRAGRRGIDEIGHSIVLLQRFTPFETITRLASTRTYPLQSSFQPSYNMAVNLVRNYDRHEAEHLVNSSFAQFQTDRDVVRLERKREKSEAYLASYRERMQCERGDFEEYWDLRTRLRKLEQRGGRAGRAHNQRVLDAIAALRPGDVIDLPAGRRRGRYAVIEVTTRRSESVPRVLVLSEERTMIRLAPVDFREPPRAVARLPLPRDFNVRDLSARRKLARRLADLDGAEPPPVPSDDADPDATDELKALRRAVERHPCASCPELGRHIHFAERAARLEKEVAGVDRQVARRTGTLARRFDLVLDVLVDLGYVQDWTLTDKGERLTRVYNESDLLVVEALDRNTFAGLEPPELAAVCSTLVYETRGPESEAAVEMPTPRARATYGELMRLWKHIRRREDERALELTREPDPGFADKAFRWAAGWPLENVLSEDDPAGDFVRATKQLIDLLRQVEEVTADDSLREVVGRAVDGLHRGVVAYSSLEL